VQSLAAAHLRKIAARILAAAGARQKDARIVAGSLVEANLDGHDSHGIVRIPDYVAWMEKGLIDSHVRCRVVRESSAFALIDGKWGWGQVVGRQCMEIAISKASNTGVGAVSARQCGHVGRVGDYAAMAAKKGMAAIMLLNTHGAGGFVAPWGGRDRRLSSNPIALAVPCSRGGPVVVDISTSAIAVGKIKVARNSKRRLPENCIIDASGRPTTDPEEFFASPGGALLPFGGHKGYALSLLTDILAGAISGAGCSRAEATRVANSFLAIVIDVRRFRPLKEFDSDVCKLFEYVKSSRLAPGFTEILVPGEPERRERARRERLGIPVDSETWRRIRETAARYKIKVSHVR
jgi:hydroxycarboxylate dehydrogenase B